MSEGIRDWGSDAMQNEKCKMKNAKWRMVRCAFSSKCAFCTLHFAFCTPANPQSLIPNPFFAALLLLSLALPGCQQKMADQPYYKDLQPNKFFADGRSERPAVPGTVARGHLQTDVALFTGRRSGKNGEPLGVAMPTTVQPPPDSRQAAAAEKAQYDCFVDEFPFPMTKEVLEHGRDRYAIYCAVCHDALGTGRGKIVERGYTQPPSYHIERLRDAPPGYLFAVMTEGYGSMPSYEAQVPVRDRWAIAGYLRALQLSQHVSKKDSPLPLGEGQGVRADRGQGPGIRDQGPDSPGHRGSLMPHPSSLISYPSSPSPHPNPLPKGEGTGQSTAAPEGKSP